MMIFKLRYALPLVLAAIWVTSCATPHAPLPGFKAQQIDMGPYKKKADHLVFVLDASSSMAEGYQGHEKLDIARSVVGNFNDTMPDLDVAVSLHSFGHARSVSDKHTDILLPYQPYNRSVLSSALSKVNASGGISSLSGALKDAARRLNGVTEPIAVVIVTDGKDMATGTLDAARALKTAHGDRICFYTVQVGDAADGAVLLSRVADVTGCGQAVPADQLAKGAEMSNFVRNVLLTAKVDGDGDGVSDAKDQCPDTPTGAKVDMRGCALDTDKDGVPDYKDQCPNTPEGTRVDAKGCPVPQATKSAEVTAAGTWIYKGVQFENNKADLKQTSFPTLNEITAALRAQPGLNIEIQGHTDSSGTREYNMGLSKRRAQSVKAYLQSQGIEGSRMTTQGFGPDRPIAENTTRAGRARNRRVEIKPTQ